MAIVGVLLPFGDAANNGPASGQLRPGMVAFGAALVVGGAALAWLAWGVWRARKWPTHIALVVSAVVIASLVWVATHVGAPLDSIFDPSTGRLVPQYDTGTQRMAFAIVPYSAAVLCLIAAELRLRARKA